MREEGRAVFKARALAGGYWGQYLEERARLVSEGMEPREARREAQARFPEGYEKGSSCEAGERVGPEREPEEEPAAEGVSGVPALAEFRGREIGSERENVQWVASVMYLSGVRAADAPSAVAWGMLQWVRGSKSAEQEFWRSVYVRLMPSRGEIDGKDRFQDDGEVLLKLIDRIEQIREAAQAG